MVAPRKIRIASSFFRYFPRWTNPCALIVYRQLERNVTKIPVSINALSSNSKSAITSGINNPFLSLMSPSSFLRKKEGSILDVPFFELLSDGVFVLGDFLFFGFFPSGMDKIFGSAVGTFNHGLG